jgi:hypothetical protein
LGIELSTSNLFNHDINLVSVLHAEVLGGLTLMKAFSVKEEANIAGGKLHKSIDTFWRWQ